MKAAIVFYSLEGNIRYVAERLTAQLSLVDPKARPSQENEERIAAFIEQMKR